MPREEKGNPMGSYDSSGSGSDSGGSSLAARRARLRGSLARASDPEASEPSAPAQSAITTAAPADTVAAAVAEPVEPVAKTQQARQLEDSDAQFDPASVTGGGGGAIANALAGAMSPKPGMKNTKPAAKTAATPPAPPLAPPAKPKEEEPLAVASKKTSPAPPLDPVSVTDLPKEPPSQTNTQSEINWGPAPSEVLSTAKAEIASSSPIVKESSPAKSSANDLPSLTPLPAIPDNAVNLLTGIDQALNACATNLSALQKLSTEQTDVLKSLSTTLQNQTLFEIGLNLTSLTESLSAALEPMKAIGELVPAMDQLVSTLEGREAEGGPEKLSPEQLVTSLADQLSAGLIDPWTFKCAYMAIYPSEHPADLLHRLVELLGTQRLSGDLFRAAYEAVQAAERPAGRARVSAAKDGGLSGIADGDIRQQIEELQRANEDLANRQEERERELGRKLQQKESELQEAQEMLNTRYDEFNSRYEEVAQALSKREDEYKALIESKDMELVEKESELNLLRAQMEELRNQTEEMVKDLQKQMTDVKSAKEERPATGFFDSAPQPGNSLFQGGGSKQLFDQAQQPAQQQTGSHAVPVAPQQPVAPPQPAPQVPVNMPTPVPTPLPTVPASPMAVGGPPTGAQHSSNVPAPQPAPTTPFASGAGSYGSGVRAQVFEVIVRQALAGAPWREICAGPMQVNNISPEEVEAEVKRRQALLK